MCKMYELKARTVAFPGCYPPTTLDFDSLPCEPVPMEPRCHSMGAESYVFGDDPLNQFTRTWQVVEQGTDLADFQFTLHQVTLAHSALSTATAQQ